GFSRCTLFGPHRGEFFGGRIAAIGTVFAQQRLRHLPVALRARKLEKRLSVPAQAEPIKTVEDSRNRLGRRSLAVGVFDPQQESAARVTRIKPVEEGGARAADVQITRG